MQRNIFVEQVQKWRRQPISRFLIERFSYKCAIRKTIAIFSIPQNYIQIEIPIFRIIRSEVERKSLDYFRPLLTNASTWEATVASPSVATSGSFKKFQFTSDPIGNPYSRLTENGWRNSSGSGQKSFQFVMTSRKLLDTLSCSVVDISSDSGDIGGEKRYFRLFRLLSKFDYLELWNTKFD